MSVDGHPVRRGRSSSVSLLLAGALAVYYLFLLTNGDWNIFDDEALGLVFNNMLLHLLKGDFTINPEIIGGEAFVRDGQTYSYFGIFPALLRLPAMPFVDLRTVSLSRLSCWIALLICAWAQLSALRCVYAQIRASRTVTALYWIVAAALVLSGPQLGLLFTSYVFNEPILWSVAFALLANRIVTARCMAGERLSPRDVYWLAVLAGLALLTRVSMAVGLYAITSGIIVVQLWREFHRLRLAGGGHGIVRALAISAAVRHAVGQGAVLAVFILPTAVVNYGRWGNPLIFMPSLYNIQVIEDPRRMAVFEHYGNFSLSRLGFNILYYFFALPGRQRLQPFIDSHFDSVGYPRSALVATATLLVVLTAIGIAALVTKRTGDSAQARLVLAITLAGQAVTLLLFLTLVVAWYRYRMDFLPFFSLGTILGFDAVARHAAARPGFGRTAVLAFASIAAINIAISHLDLLQAKLASFALSDVDRERVAQWTYPASALFAGPPPGMRP
jgi:hypothetical protein